MADDKNKVGRPEITVDQKASILRKLQPYLQSGMGVGKALQEAQIPKSTFYDLMSKDEEFSDEIARFKNFVSKLVNNVLVRELMIISEKQTGNRAKGTKPQALSSDDRKFVWQFALNSNLTKDEFGGNNTVPAFDPEVEIQKVKRLIDASTTEEIIHID